MNLGLQWAITRIMAIAVPDFYGTITLRYEAGKLTALDHHHTEKPPKLD